MIKCEECNKEFNSKDALNMHNRSKHYEKYKPPRKPFDFNKLKKLGFLLLILGILVGTFYLYKLTVKTYPPIDIKGHVETYPKSQILKEPIPLPVHKHILEHVESGAPGVVINYNCEDFECEDGLVEKLESFAKNDKRIYVAPYPKMSAKIVLSKLGKRKILSEYSEEEIKNFIK